MMEQGKLSGEVEDLLARSIKKAKMGDTMETEENETVVMETAPEKIILGSDSSKFLEEMKDTDKGCKLVSYRDVCLGEDHEAESMGSDDAEDSDDDSYMNMEGSSEDEDVSVDPRCPVVNVTKEERKQACQPWKNSIIVNLLGKGVGLKFLTLRLLKLWNPLGEMEVIDLENDYFLVKFSNFNDTNYVFQGGPG
ncbi:hypothetical protein SESBI_04316 [Sesbania bispinosa]|nr:hypothetical protein SESBI_04316 [Sesbania bispinosa]